MFGRIKDVTSGVRKIGMFCKPFVVVVVVVAIVVVAVIVVVVELTNLHLKFG